MVRLCAPSILPAELGDWEAVERMIDVRQNQQSDPARAAPTDERAAHQRHWDISDHRQR